MTGVLAYGSLLGLLAIQSMLTWRLDKRINRAKREFFATFIAYVSAFVYFIVLVVLLRDAAPSGAFYGLWLFLGPLVTYRTASITAEHKPELTRYDLYSTLLAVGLGFIAYLAIR